jgi:NAD-dependent SIR2 family protein deacetylase
VFNTLATGDPTPCPTCGGLTRPNVLFFDDFHRNAAIYAEQKSNYDEFRERCVPNRTVVLEMGAGNTVPTLRNMSVLLNANLDFPVLRINPNQVEGVDGIANMVPKSRIAPFITLQTTVSKALDAILV